MGRDSLPRGLPFDGSTVPQMHSSPRPHPDPQCPLPLLHPRVRVGTEEPGSGPGSCWATLSKSLRIAEPRISGRVNAGPRPAKGLWSPQACCSPSTNEPTSPRKGPDPSSLESSGSPSWAVKDTHGGLCLAAATWNPGSRPCILADRGGTHLPALKVKVAQSCPTL